ncbi:MAG TPA: hypothetical protein PK675_03575 [Clostridia bacterium]|nr:hypothetical protein [Clostridia bacterium]
MKENIDKIKNNRDLEEKENLKTGFLQIKEGYFNQLERLKTGDEKLNMILVFNAAILALNIVLFPLDLNGMLLIFFIAVISIFGISIFSTVILTLVGIFPRKIRSIDDCVFAEAEKYHCTNIEYYGKFISGYLDAIQSIKKSTEIKYKIIQVAIVLTVINMALIVLLIIITQI